MKHFLRSFDGFLHLKLRSAKTRWFCTQPIKCNDAKLQTSSTFLEKFLDRCAIQRYNCREVKKWQHTAVKTSVSTILDKRIDVTYHQMHLPATVDETGPHVSTAIISTPVDHLTSSWSMNIPAVYDRSLHSFDPVTSVWKEVPLTNDDIHVMPSSEMLTESNVVPAKNYTVTILSKTYPPSELFEAGYRYSPLTDFERSMMHMADQTVLINNSSPVNSNSTGRPTEEHLEHVFKSLSHCLPRFFVDTHDYSLYHPNIIFENNIRGVTTKGLPAYVQQLAMVRIIGHLKFAHVKFEMLKITKHTEDGTVRVRWRIRGISGMKMLFNIRKLRPWNWRQMFTEEADWYDGFSTFYIGGDGKVHRHVCDKMMPDDDKQVIPSIKGLATKLALLLGVVQRPLLDDINLVLASLLKLDEFFNSNPIIK